MRYLTAGESHGPALCAIIEGLPANLLLDPEKINGDLARRQQGYGRGGRMQIEKDCVEVLSGLRFGRTLGSPLALRIANRDFANWRGKMDPVGIEPSDTETLTRPRPGHADLSGALKFNLADVRDVLERASARETAARVAVGATAKALLAMFGIQVYSQIVAVGVVTAQTLPAEILAANYGKVEKSLLRTADKEAEVAMMAAIDCAKAAGDSLGGVFEVVVLGLPPGLGSYTHWDKKLDSRLAAALMSIQAVKGVEVGGGFALTALPGSLVHDQIAFQEGRGYFRLTNRAGGIEGGMTNGEPVVLRAAMKPIPTLYKPLMSVDMIDHQPFAAVLERSDACAVPAAAVVGEAVVAWEMALALREKVGGDSLEEMQANIENYFKLVAER